MRGEWRSKITPAAAIGSALGWIAAGLPSRANARALAKKNPRTTALMLHARGIDRLAALQRHDPLLQLPVLGDGDAAAT